MAGAAAAPAPITGLYTNGGVGNISLNASEVNASRIAAVIDRFSNHLCSGNKLDAAEFSRLCLFLSRCIDFAVANLEVPSRSGLLPSLMKQVCQNYSDTLLQPAIMVLMVSVKSACQNGWFSDGDSEELRNLAKQIARNFSSVSNFNTESSCSLSVIPTVMSRFYPRLKLGHIFVFLEVKPGFDAYVRDFQILKNLRSSPGDRIRLFVVQTDSIETPSCLVTPPKVNFLLNGKGVERRINLFMDTGPQIPTALKPLLKYGSNLLQAVGDFNGNYVIAVALMSEVPNTDSNTLQDYEDHAPETVCADSEVIVGQSRISLNCPISFSRIKTPVKGHSCKHIQCFDFDNYVDINSRRPSWRCPSCNQHVCFSDIRIDQKMVEVLKEVGPNVSDIIFSSDGSWNAVMEGEDTTEKPRDKTNTGKDESPQPADVLDLTQTDEVMDAAADETEDRKHSSKAHEGQFMAQDAAIHPHVANTNDVNQSTQFMTQNAAINPQISSTNDVNQSSSNVENDFWFRLYMSTYGLGSSNVRPSAQNCPFPSAQPPHQNTSFPDPNQILNTYRVSNEQQMAHLRMPRGSSQSPGLNQSSMQSSGSFLFSLSQSSLPVIRTDAHDAADLNWRRAGRMRGALSGQAYTDAVNQYIIRPNQQAQAARPISNMTSRPTNVPLQLQASMTGGQIHGIRAPNYSYLVPLLGRPVGWDFLPDGSSGMQ